MYFNSVIEFLKLSYGLLVLGAIPKFLLEPPGHPYETFLGLAGLTSF